MAKEHKLEYFILQYAPNVGGTGLINIGLLVHEADSGKFAEARFVSTWKRLEWLEPQPDFLLLESLKNEIVQRWGEEEGRNLLLNRMQELFSNTLQLSEGRTCFTDDPHKQMALLCSQYL